MFIAHSPGSVDSFVFRRLRRDRLVENVSVADPSVGTEPSAGANWA
jgi:hypothetical protein